MTDRTLDLARALAGTSHRFYARGWVLGTSGNFSMVASRDPLRLAITASGRDKRTLKARGGYTTADVIDVTPDTPGLDAMLTRFNSEHWHDEDEVRLIVEGRGLFHIHPVNGPVFVIEVYPGDLIRVPKGTHHWFDLCGERRIRAIRLFQNPSGWTPNYTHSGTDRDFQPVCFGPAYFGSSISGPPIGPA
jgi:1,2-dihydroxy-3-keto-5-methylthiopentene dioxygenase